MSLSENKNQIDNDKKEIIWSEHKQKIKLSPNKLNTKVIFQNKTEIKLKSINPKINSIKENNNKPKQIFRKINLKITSHLITNPNLANLLKIKPSNKTEANNKIKAIKSSLKNKDKTFIPNSKKSNIKNIKPSMAISEPATKIKSNKTITINKSQAKLENPFYFNLFEQPVDPMTLEMEKFKKMRIGEKNFIKKKLGLKGKLNSSNNLPKFNTNKNLNNIRKSEDISEKLNLYIKKKEEEHKDNKYIFKSYADNINKRKIVKKNENPSKEVNNTISYSNSYSINYKTLNIESDISNNNTNRQSIKTYESSNDKKIAETLRDRAKKITKEKETLKYALNSKKHSSLGSLPKNIVKRIKTIKKNSYFQEKTKENKFNKKRLSTDLEFIKSFETIPRRTSHQNKKIFPIKSYKKNSENKLNINNQKNKKVDNISKNNDVIKKKFEILLNIINLKVKSNIKYFFLHLKQYNEKNTNQEKNDKKEEIISLELNKNEKDNKINKEAFAIFSNFYYKKISDFEKYILSKLKDFSINNKKIKSIKSIKNIMNRNYISNIKFFFISLKKYISNQNKIKSTKKFILFFSQYYKSIITNAYFQIKKLVETLKKFDSTKILNNCFTKYKLKEKKNIFSNLQKYYNKSKKKEALEIMQRIYLNKCNFIKKEILNQIYMYYTQAKKIESINKIRNLLIKGTQVKKQFCIYIIKSICGYKNKMKSIRDLSDLIMRKILFYKKMCFNIIKKYIFMKKKIEGFDRFNDFMISKRLSDLRIYFLELINNIKKIRINNGFRKIEKIYFIKKQKIDNIIFNKIKQYYKAQIKKNKIISLFKSIIYKRTIANQKFVFEYFKNYINELLEYQKKMKLINNMHIDTTNSFILEKKNIHQRNDNINIIDNKNIINKVKVNNIFIKNEKDENSDDNDVWTTCVEKWNIMYNSDDSLYQKDVNE